MKVLGDPEHGQMRIEFLEKDAIRELDEIVIGDWFHLERMSGVKKRTWWMAITDKNRRMLHVWVKENDGKVLEAWIAENEWEGDSRG